MAAGSIDKMGGVVEADETYIGGLAKNMHEKKRKQRITNASDKAAVMGILERGDGVVLSRIRIIKDANAQAPDLLGPHQS